MIVFWRRAFSNIAWAVKMPRLSMLISIPVLARYGSNDVPVCLDTTLTSAGLTALNETRVFIGGSQSAPVSDRRSGESEVPMQSGNVGLR